LGFFKKNKRIQIIIALDLLGFVLFITSFFLPLTSGYVYDFVGLAYYLIRGMGLPFLAFFLLFWSIFFTYQLKPGRALILKGVSWVVLLSLIIYMLFGFNIKYFSNSSLNVGDLFLIIGVIILTLSIILEGIWRNQLLIQKYNEVRKYIKGLSENHDQVHLFEIAINQSLDERYIPRIKQEIESMIDSNKIYAELKQDNIVFKKGELIGSKPSKIPKQKPKEEIESKKDEIPPKDVKPERDKKPKKVRAIDRDIDYRKNLYGMIRVEKEIELEEAAEFLNLSEKKLKAYIYDLAGENKIQGSFTKEGKFIIESGVDNFLDALDSQFNKWEYEEKVLDKKIYSSTFYFHQFKGPSNNNFLT